MERITDKHLKSLVDWINDRANMPRNAYTTDDNGKFKSITGVYVLSGAYGGVKLERITGDGGGAEDITFGYCSRRELFEKMHMYLKGMNANK